MRRKTKQSSGWGFPVKVWLFTIVVAPFVFILALALVRSATWNELYRSLPLILLLMIFGFMLLLPALLLYGLFFGVLRHRSMPNRVKKGLLSTAGVLAIWLVYFLYDRSFFYEGGFGVYSWPLSYSLVLATAGALLKMKRPLDAGEKKAKGP